LGEEEVNFFVYMFRRVGQIIKYLVSPFIGVQASNVKNPKSTEFELDLSSEITEDPEKFLAQLLDESEATRRQFLQTSVVPLVADLLPGGIGGTLNKVLEAIADSDESNEKKEEFGKSFLLDFLGHTFKKDGPRFIFTEPKTKYHFQHDGKNSIIQYWPHSFNYPKDILTKLEKMLPDLMKTASGNNILPVGHMPLDEVPGIYAWGYPKNYEHVSECPYCLGEFAKNWLTMTPQYEKFLPRYIQSVEKVKERIPSMNKEEILKLASDGIMPEETINKFLAQGLQPPWDYQFHIKKIKKFLESMSIEDLRKVMLGTLAEQAEMFTKWVSDLSTMSKRLSSLPNFLKAARPHILEQDSKTIEDIDSKIKRRLTNAMEKASGRFILINNHGFDLLDDSSLIRILINENEAFKSKIKFKSVRLPDRNWLGTVAFALELAKKHVEENPGENLGIGFNYNEILFSLNHDLPAGSPLQFHYPVHEAYVFDLVSEIFKLSDIPTKVNFIFTDPFQRNGNKLTASDLFFEWAHAKKEGSIIIQSKWKFGEGMTELLSRLYKSKQA